MANDIPKELKNVCVFCGSSSGVNPEYTTGARALGDEFVRRGSRLVYGGGDFGLMGVLATTIRQGTIEKLGTAAVGVAGVLPRPFLTHSPNLLGEDTAFANGSGEIPAVGEVFRQEGMETHIVADMHTRKQKMAELAEYFVVLPGGYGTFEELMEMTTWTQLGIHNKPVGLLNVCGFFDPFIKLVDHMQAEGFIKEEARGIIVVDDDPKRLMDRLDQYGIQDGAQFQMDWCPKDDKIN